LVALLEKAGKPSCNNTGACHPFAGTITPSISRNNNIIAKLDFILALQGT
jgi:hypothetical protein